MRVVCVAAGAVVSGHDAQALCIFNDGLLRADIAFTGLLLGHEGCHAGSVHLRVIEAEVLDGGDDTVLQFSLADFRAHEGRKDRILGIVLEVSRAVRQTVKVGRDAPQDRAVGPQRIVTHCLAPLKSEVLVECLCHNDVVGHCVAHEARIGIICVDGARVAAVLVLVGVLAERIVRVAGRAVVLDRLGRGDRRDRLGAGSAEGRSDQRLGQIHLVDQLVPSGIVEIGDALEVGERQAVVRIPCHFAAVRLVLVDVVVHNRHHLVGRGQVSVGLGERIRPVTSGQVNGCAGHPVIDVHVSQLVLDVYAGLGGREGLVVKSGQVPYLYVLCVACSSHTVVHGSALRRQHVVDCFVSAVADGEVVVTGVQNIVALSSRRVIHSGIPACQVLKVRRDGNCLALSGLEDLSLAKIQKLDRGLLHAVLDVILRVRCGDVELYGVLARDITGICDGNCGGRCFGSQVYLHVVNLLVKRCVGEAVSEGIGHFILVHPGAACASHFRIRRALVKDKVRIAGLIVLVACVDALRLHDRVVHGDGRICVGPLQVAVVLGRRAQRVLYGISVGQVTGGVSCAAQDICHAVEAVASRCADLEDRVYAVIVGDLLDLHGVAVVQQDDDLAAVCGLGLYCCRDEVSLIVGQSQRIGLIQAVSGIYAGFTGCVVRVLGTCAADRDDHHIAGVQAVSPARVRAVQLCDGRLFVLVDAADRGCCQVQVLRSARPSSHFRLEDALERVAVVHIFQCRVEREASCFKCADKINRIGFRSVVLCRCRAKDRALVGEIALESQKGYLADLFRAQGKRRVVVLEQNAAFLAHSGSDILHGLY